MGALSRIATGSIMLAGKPLAHEYKQQNIELVQKGCSNLARHIENCQLFGVPVVVAVNKFVSDTDNELGAVKDAAINAGVHRRHESMHARCVPRSGPTTDPLRLDSSARGTQHVLVMCSRLL